MCVEHLCTLYTYLICVVKIKHSLYRPGQDQTVVRKLRFPDVVTMAQDGGRFSALLTGRLCPQKIPWYSFLLKAESTQGPLCNRKHFVSIKNPLTTAGIKPETFRFVAQHLNHCATTVPLYVCTGL